MTTPPIPSDEQELRRVLHWVMEAAKAHYSGQPSVISPGDVKMTTRLPYLIIAGQRAAVEATKEESVQDFCQRIADAVRLMYESGGRPGHIIDPWSEIVRPIVYGKLQRPTESVEEEDKP